jgi:hypothetical protein
VNRLARLAQGGLGGLLLAGALAAPAAAEAPQSAPTPFYNSVEAEDGCTLFETAGETDWAEFSPPESKPVTITGKLSIGSGAPPGRPCLPVVPADRQIEFTGHVNDWPAVEHIVPMPTHVREGEYEFDLEAPGGAEIEYITVRICRELRADGSDWSARCGGSTLIERGATAEEAPYCEFEFTILDDWHSGYTGQGSVTAVQPVGDWNAVIAFPGGQILTQLWNAEVEQSGSGFTVTPASWNGRIPSGTTTRFGFVVAGESQPPPEVEIRADGHECAAV